MLKPERIKRKPWITNEILDLMDERRRLKNIDAQKYRTIHKEIQKKIKEAKEKQLLEECLEIERYDKMYDDSFNMHKKIKEITGTNKKKLSGILKNNRGEVITNVKDKVKHWTEYIKELFDDNRPPIGRITVRGIKIKNIKRRDTICIEKFKEQKSSRTR